MNPRTARLLLRLYPHAWRERYGEEFTALLAQQPLTWEGVLDIGRGAYDARQTAARRHGQRAALDAPTSRQRKEQTVTANRRVMKCSFCGKDQTQVRRLIAGPNWIAICDECVVLCNDILAEAPPSGQLAETRESSRSGHTPWWRRLGARWLAEGHVPHTFGQTAGMQS